MADDTPDGAHNMNASCKAQLPQPDGTCPIADMQSIPSPHWGAGPCRQFTVAAFKHLRNSVVHKLRSQNIFVAIFRHLSLDSSHLPLPLQMQVGVSTCSMT